MTQVGYNPLDALFEAVDIRKIAKKVKPKADKKSEPKASGTPVHGTPKAPKPAKGRTPSEWLEHYTPHMRVTYAGVQQCQNCGKETHYVAGDLLEYWQKERVAGLRTIRTRALTACDERFRTLPRRIEYLQPESCTCLECLHLEAITDAGLAALHVVHERGEDRRTGEERRNMQPQHYHLQYPLF